jgi:hypothetical protein
MIQETAHLITHTGYFTRSAMITAPGRSSEQGFSNALKNGQTAYWEPVLLVSGMINRQIQSGAPPEVCDNVLKTISMSRMRWF